MSAGSLFHTVAAATAKAPVPMTVFVRCTTSFMVSADRKCRRLRTVEAKTQLSAKYWPSSTMDAFEDRHGHLKVNSMSNRKPMKVAQYWCYVVNSWCQSQHELPRSCERLFLACSCGCLDVSI